MILKCKFCKIPNTDAMKKPATSVVQKTAKPAKQKVQVSRETFEENLHELYWCEKQLAALLPDFSKRATSYELTSAIEAHLAVTENQIIRLIHVFDAIGERAVGKNCQDISDIIEQFPVAATESGYERDTTIINCCQKIMEYEIRTYTMLQMAAQKLKEELASEFLAIAVKEEKNTYSRLTEISLSSIYFDAAS